MTVGCSGKGAVERRLKRDCVIEDLDLLLIYCIPEALHKQKTDSLIMEGFNLKPKKKFDDI
jgi:CTP synthase (UTP-ammonia lyase)